MGGHADWYDDWANSHSVTSALTNMRIDNNATWQDAFQFGTQGDTTWSLAGQGFELDVQLTPFDTAPLLSLSTANGRIVIDDTVQRVIHFDVDPADIQSSLTPGIYIYDLVMVSTSNPAPPADRTILMHGTLRVNQGVTYPPAGA
jgi:hypothetical protein